MIKLIKKIAAVTAFLLVSSSAYSHVWYIGWESHNDGSADFYGLSDYTGGLGTYDDFALFPAGFVINGMHVPFDLGSAVNLGDCYGFGDFVGTCDATWNALVLDAGIRAANYSNNYYRKYASVNLDSAELGELGIKPGNNLVEFWTYAGSSDWSSKTFSRTNVSINLVVQPDSTVPEPTSIAILTLGLIGVSLSRRAAKK